MGLAPNKLVAKIASDFRKPDGLTVIVPEAVQDFLDPLSIRVIPGIGPKTEVLLRARGIRAIRELRAVEPSRLVEWLGKWGHDLHERARGVSLSPVSNEWERKSVGEQDHDPGRHVPVERVIAAQEHRGRLAPPSGRLGEAPRPRDRQRGPDAVLPGRIAGRGDDSPPLSLLRIGADDDRSPAELRITPLLDRGVERIHVDVGDDPHRARPSAGIDPVDRKVEDLVALQRPRRGARGVLGAERVVQDERDPRLRGPAVRAESMTRES